MKLVARIADAVLGPKTVLYRREDKNVAVYKVRRSTMEPLLNGGKVVGFRAVKVAGTGTDLEEGWRSFRFDRIVKATN